MGKRYPRAARTMRRRFCWISRGARETAEHIAFKLVHHFITDEPTPAMVDPLKQVFLETDGDLKQVALALIDCRKPGRCRSKKSARPMK